MTLIAGGSTSADDDVPAIDAKLGDPVGLAVDALGTIWFTETGFHDNALRSVTPDGLIHTNLTGLDGPQGIDVAPDNRVVVADRGGSRVVTVSPEGKLTTLAGTQDHPGSDGDGGPARRAGLEAPYDIAIDAAGTVYIADAAAQRVRAIDARTGKIDTVAGNGGEGWTGDGALATDATVQNPRAIAVDPADTDLYIADYGSSHLRHVDLDSGVITTIAGDGAGDGPYDPAANALATGLSGLSALALDAEGTLYLPVFYTDKGILIMKLDGEGELTPVTGLGSTPTAGVPVSEYHVPAAVNAMVVDPVSGSLLLALGDGTIVAIPGIQPPTTPHPPLP